MCRQGRMTFFFIVCALGFLQAFSHLHPPSFSRILPIMCIKQFRTDTLLKRIFFLLVHSCQAALTLDFGVILVLKMFN